jgi:hypothetical protein
MNIRHTIAEIIINKSLAAKPYRNLIKSSAMPVFIDFLEWPRAVPANLMEEALQ